MRTCRYVIVTPAFNEAQYLKDTIESVISQTTLPVSWVIVDDGSTDNTAEIIQSYTTVYPWIHYLRREKKAGQTYYASNVYAILYGVTSLRHEPYDMLAVLDADITLCPDYYEQILRRFEKNPELGIATGVYCEKQNEQWVEVQIDRQSTPKALQVFRRQCYEACGGYIPMMYGGEDAAIEVTARQKKWQTWSFPDIAVKHNRPLGTGCGSKQLKAKFNSGLTDYAIGMHPLFVVFKSLRRCFCETPLFISGIARLCGHAHGALSHVPRQLPLNTRRYLRQEQMFRLLRVVRFVQPSWKPVSESSNHEKENHSSKHKYRQLNDAGTFGAI